MKMKYFTFLLFFILSSVLILFLNINNEIGATILSNISLLIGFCIVYVLAVISIISNKDAVVRLKNPAPSIIPIAIYISICLTDFFIHKPESFYGIIIFFILLTVSTAFYFAAIIYLLTDLKDAMINKNKYTPKIKDDSPKKKLLLINPINKAKNNKAKNNAIPPMGLAIIAALTPDQFDIKLIDENFNDFKYEDADLVGITSFTADVNRAYEIAAIYRAKKIPVIMGGIHATVRTEEALNYVDTVVTGEAEYVWKDVINDFLNNSLKRTYEGLAVEAVDFVKPRRDLFDYRYLFGTIQTSRGCPFNCSFCAVSSINGRKYRQRPVNDILDELETIDQKHVFFLDDNILGYGKEPEARAVELFKGIIDRKIKKEWFCQSSINFGMNEEVLNWASKSGCKMVYLGLESPNPDELKGMNKFINTKIDYKQAFKNINKHGIAVVGAFIYGSEEETEKSMKYKTDYIINNDIDVIETKVYTPLPGTELFKNFNKEKKLVFTNFPHDWDQYNLTKVTYKMKNMSDKEFTACMKECANKLLSKKTLIKKFIKTLFHTKRISTAFWALNSNLTYVVTNQVTTNSKS